MTARKLAVIAAALIAFAAPAAASASHAEALSQAAVFTQTNSAAGNGVATFARNADGTLTYAGTAPSGGLGTGANLGSQGAIALAADGHTLFAVNAGSDSISEFAVSNTSVSLVTTFSSNATFRSASRCRATSSTSSMPARGRSPASCSTARP